MSLPPKECSQLNPTVGGLFKAARKFSLNSLKSFLQAVISPSIKLRAVAKSMKAFLCGKIIC
jgi:hypothetical protein